VTSDPGFETVNPILQGLKRGGKGGNLTLKLDDSLGGGGVGDAGFRPLVLRQ
jgi:hypothetical protein